MTGTARHSAPEGTLIYALSDIHGRNDLLRRLLDDIERDARGIGGDRRLLVFLGDYIDRGADSAGAVETLVSGLP
ncbi:MAG: metallophosphoesterase, partial [Hyphomicrobiales bacterium]